MAKDQGHKARDESILIAGELTLEITPAPAPAPAMPLPQGRVQVGQETAFLRTVPSLVRCEAPLSKHARTASRGSQSGSPRPQRTLMRSANPCISWSEGGRVPRSTPSAGSPGPGSGCSATNCSQRASSLSCVMYRSPIFPSSSRRSSHVWYSWAGENKD